MREMPCGEIYKLEGCLRELAEHHNLVSVNFSGAYSDVKSSQVIFGKLTEYICEHIALTSAVPENEREDLIENSGIW